MSGHPEAKELQLRASDGEREPTASNHQRSHRSNSSNSSNSSNVAADSLKWLLLRYRLRYFFGRSCCDFCGSVARRLPTGGLGVYGVLLVLGLEQMAFVTAGQAIIGHFTHALGLDSGLASLAARSIGLNLLANLLFPFMGWLADVWVGRHRMIHLSSWILWCGYASAAILLSIDGVGVVSGGRTWNNYLLLPCYVLINAGSSGFQANAIPFGADQIQYKTSHELSSYFYIYYWIRNAGSISLFLLVSCEGSFEGHSRGAAYSSVAAGLISVNLVLLACLRSRFFTTKERCNPLKTLGRVLYTSAMTKRPRYRSAFSYNPSASLPSRLDLTKEVHGGSFEEETVEDVKTFLRMLLVLCTLGFVLYAYVGVTGSAGAQLQFLKRDILRLRLSDACSFGNSFVWVFNITGILVVIPLVNSALFPFLREYTPTILRKIGFGSVLTALTPLIFIVISSVGHVRASRDAASSSEGSNVTDAAYYCMFDDTTTTTLPVPLWAILAPFILLDVAEVFVNVSSIEFFYAQSPHTMRGMMVGLFFFTWGIASTLVEVVIFIFTNARLSLPWTCDLWFYLMLQSVAVLGLVLFLVVARKYKNRQRGEIKPEKFYREPHNPSL